MATGRTCLVRWWCELESAAAHWRIWYDNPIYGRIEHKVRKERTTANGRREWWKARCSGLWCHWMPKGTGRRWKHNWQWEIFSRSRRLLYFGPKDDGCRCKWRNMMNHKLAMKAICWTSVASHRIVWDTMCYLSHGALISTILFSNENCFFLEISCAPNSHHVRKMVKNNIARKWIECFVVKCEHVMVVDLIPPLHEQNYMLPKTVELMLVACSKLTVLEQIHFFGAKCVGFGQSPCLRLQVIERSGALFCVLPGLSRTPGSAKWTLSNIIDCSAFCARRRWILTPFW